MIIQKLPPIPGFDVGHENQHPSISFQFKRGRLAGQVGVARLLVCKNPCCPCGGVDLYCRMTAGPDRAQRVRLDVLDRGLRASPDSNAQDEALGRAFAAEAEPDDWAWLRDYFFSCKRAAMETMAIETIDAQFPEYILNGDTTMVSYADIFPWAESFSFELSGEEWYADDQYCIAPDCGCTGAGLSFFRAHSESAPAPKAESWSAFLHYDYESGRPSGEEAQEQHLTPAEFLGALHAHVPQLGDILRKRHGQLKQLARRLLQNAEVPVTSPPKTRRNDPCPCGSGKKFKKCCGSPGIGS